MTTIKINDNGPIVIEGDIDLCDASGAKFGIGERKRISLCRCGLSANKPFCDGTHGRQAFASKVEARIL